MKVMSYTDPLTAAVFPGSAWAPLGVFLDHHQRLARVVFLGYADAAAANEHRTPIAQKEYQVSGASYLALVIQAGPSAPMLAVVAAACYALAEATLDTVNPADPTGPRVSFFHNASDEPYLG